MCKPSICSAGAALLGPCQQETQGSALFAASPATLPGSFAMVLAALQEESGVHVPPASRLRTAASQPKVKI